MAQYFSSERLSVSAVSAKRTLRLGVGARVASLVLEDLDVGVKVEVASLSVEEVDSDLPAFATP